MARVPQGAFEVERRANGLTIDDADGMQPVLGLRRRAIGADPGASVHYAGCGIDDRRLKDPQWSLKGTPLADRRPARLVLKLCQPSRRTVACSGTAVLVVALAVVSEVPAGSRISTATEARCGQGSSKLRNSAEMRVPSAVQMRPTIASPLSAGAMSKSPAPKNTWVVLRGASRRAAPKPSREKQ